MLHVFSIVKTSGMNRAQVLFAWKEAGNFREIPPKLRLNWRYFNVGVSSTVVEKCGPLEWIRAKPTEFSKEHFHVVLALSACVMPVPTVCQLFDFP
jgi:hypothetical protein